MQISSKKIFIGYIALLFIVLIGLVVLFPDHCGGSFGICIPTAMFFGAIFISFWFIGLIVLLLFHFLRRSHDTVSVAGADVNVPSQTQSSRPHALILFSILGAGYLVMSLFPYPFLFVPWMSTLVGFQKYPLIILGFGSLLLSIVSLKDALHRKAALISLSIGLLLIMRFLFLLQRWGWHRF